MDSQANAANANQMFLKNCTPLIDGVRARNVQSNLSGWIQSGKGGTAVVCKTHVIPSEVQDFAMKAVPCHVCPSQQRPIQLGADDARLIDRREFLWRFGGGLGGIAMASLLGQQGLLADTAPARPEFNGGLHHPAKAKRVVQLFMSGAASQCDTFDYKPALIERSGQKFDPGGKVELFQSDPGAVMKSP